MWIILLLLNYLLLQLEGEIIVFCFAS
uniref:Uncharacterized protein n=1 Tax=Arundo donax TaxID=35708 RepID=A0A0A8ZCM2_ARUDO